MKVIQTLEDVYHLNTHAHEQMLRKRDTHASLPLGANIRKRLSKHTQLKRCHALSHAHENITLYLPLGTQQKTEMHATYFSILLLRIAIKIDELLDQ